MTRPQRIQRERTTSWRLPRTAVYVGRGSGWGNPFTVGVGYREIDGVPQPTQFQRDAVRVQDHAHAVTLYRRWLAAQKDPGHVRSMLGGFDLACWCPHDRPCHVDVLLEMANS